jgi:hypothetical protein
MKPLLVDNSVWSLALRRDAEDIEPEVRPPRPAPLAASHRLPGHLVQDRPKGATPQWQDARRRVLQKTSSIWWQ